MRQRQYAADAAKSLLSSASRRLFTFDPTRVPEVSGALDQSLDWTMDDVRGCPNRSFEPSFSETSANTLGFLVSPGDAAASAQDRTDIASGAIRRIVGHQFGPSARRWLDGRIEPYLRSRVPARHGRGFGAMFATGLDRGGVSEAAITYEWKPDTIDTLPGPVLEMARTAMASLPGLVPFYTSIRCGRLSGGQQVTFELDRALPLAGLKPLMDAFGMGHRHGGLMSLTGFILGARFTLPPRTSTVTFMRTRDGVEMRLDINLDALPDTPEQLLPLLRLPMTERPRSLAAFDRWVTALTPEGYYGPGYVTVLSIRVRSDMPARVALFLRPVAFQPDAGRPAKETDNGDRQVENGVGNVAPPLPPATEIAPEQMPA
jgi:hypothetical protein